MDFTDIAVHIKELMFIRIPNCSEKDIDEIFRISQIFHAPVIDYTPAAVLIESVQIEKRNHDLISLLEKCCPNRMEIVCCGSVAVEA